MHGFKIDAADKLLSQQIPRLIKLRQLRGGGLLSQLRAEVQRDLIGGLPGLLVDGNCRDRPRAYLYLVKILYGYPSRSPSFFGLKYNADTALCKEQIHSDLFRPRARQRPT